MNETLIIAGGVYTVGLIIFHLLFWKIFRWPESLMTLSRVDRATMQVLNISITFIFVIFAYLSFAYTDALLNTELGNVLLMSISMLWIFRTLQQILFYRLKHKASVGLTFYFFLGACLYGLPLII